MADRAFSDEFLGHNRVSSDHDDIANSDDNSDEDPMLGTQGVDYTTLEHIHDNCNNRGRGSVHWRLCSESSLRSRK